MFFSKRPKIGKMSFILMLSFVFSTLQSVAEDSSKTLPTVSTEESHTVIVGGGHLRFNRGFINPLAG